MSALPYVFPRQQAECLIALKEGRYRPSSISAGHPAAVSLEDAMPPVYHQGLQGSCVASAVTALLEYYGDCKVRLSVQFLHAATRELERAGLERNLADVQAGRPVSDAFANVYRAGLMQLQMLADANGGMQSPVMKPYLAKFVDSARRNFENDRGNLLQTCFRVVEEQGVCRYSFWPSMTVSATPVFGAAGPCEFPSGAKEDAFKRRVVSGLYLLATPNNVDGVRGILAGAGGRRPMPVVATVSFFEGCDGERFAFPECRREADGRVVSLARRSGVHGLLLVGYRDDPSAPGGGWFRFRNSLGEEWGDGGYGWMPYAYLECFAVEAGTILQDMVDYAGDEYGGTRPRPQAARERVKSLAARHPRALNAFAACAIAALTVAAVGAVGLFRGGRGEGGEMPPPRQGPTAPPAGGQVRGAPAEHGQSHGVGYKVFFACENADVRRRLRESFASEDVRFPIEFLRQNLSSVFSLRIVLEEGDDIYAELEGVLKRNFRGSDRERWTNVSELVRERTVYVVRDTMHVWRGGM